MQSAQPQYASRSHYTTFKTVGIFVPKLIRETCRRRGFINVDIVLRWREIVGKALARYTWPMRIQWPRKQDTILRPDGTEAPSTHRTRLIVGATPSRKLDVEYAKHEIMDRVNSYLGYRAITELAASDDYSISIPLDDNDAEPTTQHYSRPTAADATGDPLKDALARLGEAVKRRPN